VAYTRLRTFHVHNFGCRATQADGSALASQLTAQGLAASSVQPDLVVLNSCTVTATADQDVHKMVNRVRREHPAARILITGCYAQRAPEQLAALPGVEWVVGNSHKDLIPEIVLGSGYHGNIHASAFERDAPFLSAPIVDAGPDRTRPNLKIQDGCNNRCSFCIIPSVRGASRSASPDWVVEQVRHLAAQYREIVLTGINLGRWGRDRDTDRPAGRMRLPELLRRLLDETPVARLRLSSVEPMDFSNDLLGLMASTPRLAQHVHAPLQSGSDTVLRRMYRKYRPRHYEDRVRQARALMPDAAIGADVMVGFPGETEAEFEETRAFIDALPFTYLHVFTYSERPGTAAAAAGDSVPLPVRKERNRVLRELAASKNAAFRQRFAGRRLSAVTLDGNRALTTNYLTVELARPTPSNELRDVEIGGVTPQGLREAGAFHILA